MSVHPISVHINRHSNVIVPDLHMLRSAGARNETACFIDKHGRCNRRTRFFSTTASRCTRTSDVILKTKRKIF